MFWVVLGGICCIFCESEIDCDLLLGGGRLLSVVEVDCDLLLGGAGLRDCEF